MNRKGIASGGNLIIDHVKLVDSYPKPGNLSNIISIDKGVGGAPLNCLVDLAVMDPSIKLQAIGIIGDDDDGRIIQNTFKKYNIDTSLVYIDKSGSTSFSDVIADKSTGERTFFHNRGVNAKLGLEHFDFSRINADILHIGYILLLDKLDSYNSEYGTEMAKMLALAQKHGLKTSIDVVSENSERFSRIVPPSLKYTNYCIINEVEASMTTGISARRENGVIDAANVKKICTKLFEMGVKDLVVIHAPEGGFCMDTKGIFYSQPSFELPKGYIKGTVGAGDAFCAGMLYSIYKDLELNTALKIANAAAACCLSKENSTDGMKSIEDISRISATMHQRKDVIC